MGISPADYRRGSDLKIERIRASIPQLAVAQAAGIAHTQLCRYERGVRPIPDDVYDRVLAAIDELIPVYRPVFVRPRVVKWNGQPPS